MLVIVVLAALFAPLIAPYDPYAQDLNQVLQGPSPQHWLGTDTLGRDTLSRIIYGAQIALLIGVGTVAMAATIGTSLGLIAAYFGGWVFTVIMRFTDAMMAIPALLFALVISTLLGSGINAVLIAVGAGIDAWLHQAHGWPGAVGQAERVRHGRAVDRRGSHVGHVPPHPAELPLAA